MAPFCRPVTYVRTGNRSNYMYVMSVTAFETLFLSPPLSELRYHQEMLKLARKTHTAVADLKHQEECLPLVDLFLDSVDQVRATSFYVYIIIMYHKSRNFMRASNSYIFVRVLQRAQLYHTGFSHYIINYCTVA